MILYHLLPECCTLVLNDWTEIIDKKFLAEV